MKSSPGSARKGAAGRITKECEPGIIWTIPDELMTPTHNAEPAAPPSTQTKAPDGPRTFTLWERVQISFASLLGYFAVLVIGPSLRWEVIGWENHEAEIGRAHV